MSGEDLLEVFLQEGWEGLSALEGGVAALRGRAADAKTSRDAYYAAISLTAHRLRGSAGLYGYPQLSALAALAERLTAPRPQLEAEQRAQLLEVLELVTLGLNRALSGIGSGQGEGELGLFFAELGGAQALQALLRSAPGAFASGPTSLSPRPLNPVAGPPDGSRPPARPAPTGVAAGLQAFVRQNAEIWSFFAPEIREYLDVLRGELDRGEQADVTLLFRAAHTTKGSAFMVGLPLMGQLAHRLEDLMDAVREQKLPLVGRAAGLLERGTGLLEQILLTAEAQDTPGGGTLAEDIAALERQVRHLLDGDTEAPDKGVGQTQASPPGATEHTPASTSRPAAETGRSGQSIRVSTERLDRLMEGVGQLVMSRARLDRQLERLAQIEESLGASHARVQRVVRDFEEKYLNPDMLRGAASEPEGGTEPEDSRLRDTGLRGTVGEVFEELEFDSYDDMNILARSVTEMSADLGELRRQLHEGSEALRDEAGTFSKVLRSLRGDVARTRRVTLEQAYVRPRRWARGQPHAELVTLGGGLEADAFVTQGLSEVLLHLVTNAFTHAFSHGQEKTAQETAAERARLGKPAMGRVTVEARTNGTFLEVSVSDDGQGISARQVREQALARGLRSGRELDALSDEEALRLILLPGLSTARELSNEAGRGVGMDIVASTVRRMGGELQIANTPDVGTTFTLRLPLSQQVLDLLTVQVGAQRLGFPTASIAALRELQPGEVVTDGVQLRLPGGTPLYLLHPLWNEPLPGGALNAVVLKTAAGEVAFGVDHFGSIAEAVIEAPGSCLEALGYVSGTTVSADGTPVLVPDAAGLTRLLRGWSGRRVRHTDGRRADGPGANGAQTGDAALNDAASGPRAPSLDPLLLVDDSLSVRRAVSRMLSRAGYQVVTASDGLEALEALRGGLRVQAILTDLEMPRANGFEVIEEVRRHDAQLPIVVMTTRSGEKHQRLAFQLGASDYFSKPVDEALLTRCLARLLGSGDVRTP